MVEGIVDRAVLNRLMSHANVTTTAIYVANGKAHIHEHLDGYNSAARFAPWIVLVDLNHEAACAPDLRRAWLPQPAPHMCFRVAVREIEAWLLADRQRLSSYLSVAASALPLHPEDEADPKLTMVRLAGRSRRLAIRTDMTPRPGSGRAVGPAYSSRLIEFVSDTTRGWRPDVAAQHSSSLRRCLERIRQLAATGRRTTSE